MNNDPLDIGAPNPILITMEGGLIQDILGIPAGCTVVVRNADVEGVDLGDYYEQGDLFKDADGAFYTQHVWPTDVPAVAPAHKLERATAEDMKEFYDSGA